MARGAGRHQAADGRQRALDPEAKANKLVVGSQARILYADAQGRMEIAKAFNDAIKDGRLAGTGRARP